MLTTDGSLPQQLGVVWSRLLEADSEGPSFISHAACARSVSSSRTFLSCACGALSIAQCPRTSVSGVLLSGRSLEGGCGRIGPGQELVETALGMAGDDAADHVGQVGPWLDPDELARLDQG